VSLAPLRQLIGIGIVGSLLGGCAETVHARRVFEINYSCPSSKVTARAAGYRSVDYTPVLVTGCGHEVEYDCTSVSGYPVSTADDVVCTERGRAAGRAYDGALHERAVEQ
jgi:hypothetical protein